MRDRTISLSVSARRRPRVTGRSGLSLVELLVAITILAIGLAAYLKLSLASRVAVDKGSYYALASATVANQLANYQGQGYAALPANGTTSGFLTVLPGGQETITVGPLDGNAANLNIKQIDITVSWGYGLPAQAGSVKQSLLVSAYP